MRICTNAVLMRKAQMLFCCGCRICMCPCHRISVFIMAKFGAAMRAPTLADTGHQATSAPSYPPVDSPNTFMLPLLQTKPETGLVDTDNPVVRLRKMEPHTPKHTEGSLPYAFKPTHPVGPVFAQKHVCTCQRGTSQKKQPLIAIAESTIQVELAMTIR